MSAAITALAVMVLSSMVRLPLTISEQHAHTVRSNTRRNLRLQEQ
jgi:hypothetical protein